jgi:geranylgeranyl reductase
VIVGAGPGGLNCAKVLGSSGKKVLVLEQNSVIGPKVCAGGLTNDSINYLEIPESLLDNKFGEVVLHTPSQSVSVKHIRNFIYTVDRKKFGQWQLKKLDKKFVTVKTDSRVTQIGDNYVIVNDDEKVGFKYLVGADGSNSIVRKHLGIKNDEIGISIQYVIPTKIYKKLELFFDYRLFGLWYAWIFPHKEYVSVGCGCDLRRISSKKLVKNFKFWLKNNEIDVSGAVYEAFTINADFQGWRFGNIFLVGDAAGFASGLTGEGIYQALVSGDEAAKTIVDRNYEPERVKEILMIKRAQNHVLHFLIILGPFRKIFYRLVGALLQIKIFRSIIRRYLYQIL